MMRTRIAVGLGLVLAGLALSACGQRLPADARLAAAQQATSEADTARMAMEFASEMGGDGAGMNMTVAGDGEIDFAAEQAALELEVPRGGSEQAATVIDGDVAYTQTQSAAGDGDEARWRRHSDTVGGAEMLFHAGMDGAPDPTSLLSALDGADGQIAELGADQIRGEPVDGFGFTTDAATLAGHAEVADDDFADVAVDIEAWLDAANRVRRLTATVALADLAAADSADGDVDERVADGHITVTLELFDFGADVAIDVPTDDVIDPTEPTSAPELESAPASEAEPPDSDAIERKATGRSTEAEVEAEPGQPVEPAEPPSGSQASPEEPPGQTPGEDGN